MVTAYHRFHEPIDFSYVESLHKDDIKLIWVDRHHRDDELGPLLLKIDSSPAFFDNLTPAIEYISTSKDTLQFFVIVSGEFCEEMIRLSERLSQVHFLFIYCIHVARYEHLKENSLKLSAICNHSSQLIHSIEKAQNSTSVAIARQYSIRDLKKEPAMFIWFQLLKNLIEKLTIDDNEMSMNDLKEEIKNYYHDNVVKREKLLKDFENYKPENVIWWYTQQASLSNIINQALRQQDIDLLYKCRCFIRDLSRRLTELRKTSPTTFRVYRGTVLSKESFNKLKHATQQRTFVSTFGYMSTSKNSKIAGMFADNQSKATNDSSVSVMYEIDVDSSTNVTAVDISKISEFSEEEEVLFDIDSTFEVLKTKFDETNRLYTICMQTSTYGHELASEYLRYNEKESDGLTIDLLFGRLITDMGEFNKSIRYFERLIDQENIDQIMVRINLGRAYALKGDYENAYKYYDDARKRETNGNSLRMAEIMTNLGWLNNTLGDYKAAIEKYRTSLELYDKNQGSSHWQIKGALHTNIAMAQTALSLFDEAKRELNSSDECMKKAGLPKNHQDFSQHQMNLGKIWQSCGNYDEAKHCYNEALEMRKRFLPPGHLDIGKTLYSLGSVTGEAATVHEDYEKALAYFRESLIINENAVGGEHPATALVWSGIANVYLCRDEHEQALKYQLKVLELNQKIYDYEDHEDIGRVLNNIGELHRRMKNYGQAFVFLKASLTMRISALGADHFDTGTVHVNLAETYRDIKNYHTALEHAQTGVELWRRKLLPSATYMTEGEELLVQLRELIAQSDSADASNVWKKHST